MKAQILKIAGVKSEKEFYKKFPTEAAFMKKHGKELAKLNKAQVGMMVQSDTAPTQNVSPIDLEKLNRNTLSQFDSIKDKSLELGVDSLTTDEEKEEEELKQMKKAALLKQIEGGNENSGGGGLMGMLGDAGKFASMLGGMSGDGGSDDFRYENAIYKELISSAKKIRLSVYSIKSYSLFDRSLVICG